MAGGAVYQKKERIAQSLHRIIIYNRKWECQNYQVVFSVFFSAGGPKTAPFWHFIHPCEIRQQPDNDQNSRPAKKDKAPKDRIGGQLNLKSLVYTRAIIGLITGY